METNLGETEESTGYCLNRTMQYGNKYFMNIMQMTDSKFKSYYVVWKQHGSNNFGSCRNRFKSYYVVWKRCVHFS